MHYRLLISCVACHILMFCYSTEERGLTHIINPFLLLCANLFHIQEMRLGLFALLIFATEIKAEVKEHACAEVININYGAHLETDEKDHLLNQYKSAK